MKHTEMIPLMGQRVKVHRQLVREYKKGRSSNLVWESQCCKPCQGWIVGFTYKLDGYTEQVCFNNCSALFRETDRQLCVVVKLHPVHKPIFVPLNGYTLNIEELWKSIKDRKSRKNSEA